MRVALLTDGIYPFVMGGMQKHSYHLAKYLALRSVEVDVYHFFESDDTDYVNLKRSFFGDIDSKYVHLKRIPYPARKHFPGHYLAERYIYSKNVYETLSRSGEYDFIYVQGFAGWYTLKNKINIKARTGINFHGYEMYQRVPDLSTWLRMQMLKMPVKRNVRRADVVYSFGGIISDILRDKIKIDEIKIKQFPNGIEEQWLTDYPQSDHDRLKLVFVGRYERRKGIEELTHVLREMVLRKEIEFHFIGPIPEHKRLQKGNVIYHGLLRNPEDIKSILRSCDVLVCPSYAEGMPTVILEAMASGLAVAAADVGAVKQMVSENNGWLLRGDISNELVNFFHALEEMDQRHLHKMKEESISRVKEGFLWGNIIDQLIGSIHNNHKNRGSLVSDNQTK